MKKLLIFSLFALGINAQEITHNFTRTLMPTSIQSAPFRIDAPFPKALDTAHIAVIKAEFAKDFKMRSYLAAGTYAVSGASILWFAYKLGLFDMFLPGTLHSHDQLPVQPDSDNAELIKETLSKAIAYMRIQDARIAAIEANKNIPTGHWLINGIKSVGWTGLTVATGIMIQSRWHRFFEYALSEPSFEWFFTKHSFLPTLERIQYTLEMNGNTLYNPIMLDHVNQSFVPTMKSLAHNLEQLVAFSDYYLSTIDANTVEDQGMNLAPQGVLHSSNQFLYEFNQAYETKNFNRAISIVDQFKRELTHWIQRAALFEKEIVAA